MTKTLNGFANILYWLETNCQQVNVIPLRTISFSDKCLVVKFSLNEIELAYKDIEEIRIIRKPVRRVQFLGRKNGRGYRLHFVPLRIAPLLNSLKEQKLEVKETIEWYTWSANNSDRDQYNIPDYPTG